MNSKLSLILYYFKKYLNYERFIRKIISDKLFTKRQYKKIFGHNLNLKNPQKFSEKIQWLKLYQKDKRIELLSDKYAVRNYVSKKIGKKYLNPLLGIYKNANDINFDNLPNSFVLKTNHGCGWNIICSDKNNLDTVQTRKTLNKWLRENYYYYGREYNYKNIKPIILCEKYLGANIKDYKFLCFHGKVKYIWVDVDRYINHTRNIYDTKWKQIPLEWHESNYLGKIAKPKNLSTMISLSEKLAGNFNVVRVDFYLIKEKIIFSELTFYPGNGMLRFNPEKYDYIFGKLLKLPYE